jgi:hypothetical protein
MQQKAQKKKAPVKKITTTTVTEEVAGSGTEESPLTAQKKIDERDWSNYDKELRAYIGQNKDVGTEYVATLYKYDSMARSRQYQVTQARNSMMTSHEVGMKYGSGDYRYVVTFDNPELHIPPFYLVLHTSYDEMRAESGKAALPDPRSLQQNRNTLPDTIDLMEKLAGVFLKMQPAQAVQQNPMAGMAQFSETMNMVLQKQFLQQMSLQKQLMEAGLVKPAAQLPAAPAEPEPEEQGFMEKLAPFMPLIEKMVGVILGGGPMAGVAVETAKTIPQIAEMLNDKGKLMEAVAELDQKFGPEETDKILKQFGKKRPAVPTRALKVA